jgi:antitoxin component of RelBE/YafQ-DinJ toxin-antitoxin module
MMTTKHIVIPLEVEYLQQAAKERGISRSKLVRLVMQKVVSDDLIPVILGNENLADAEPTSERYRRFRDRGSRSGGHA